MPRKPKEPPFSAMLISARHRAGLTQEETATLTGYSLSSITKFEIGNRTPRLPAKIYVLGKLEEVIARNAAKEGGES